MFRSLIRISEVNLENTSALGENTETSFVFSLAYSYLCTRMD